MGFLSYNEISRFRVTGDCNDTNINEINEHDYFTAQMGNTDKRVNLKDEHSSLYSTYEELSWSGYDVEP